MTRGRPKMAPEDKAPPKPRRNVSLEPEVQEELTALAAELAPRFGFTPTLSQTVKYAIKTAREQSR